MPHLDEGTVHSWLDGALPPDEAARAEAHVASCAACSAMVAEARGLIAAASRILTALDDVPGQVVPSAAPAAPPPAPATGDVVPLDAQRARWWRVTPNHLRVAAALAFIAGTSVLVSRMDEGSIRAESDYGPVATTAASADSPGSAAAPSAMPVPSEALNTQDAAGSDPRPGDRPLPGASPEAPMANRAEPVRRQRGVRAPLPSIVRDGATEDARADEREERAARKAASPGVVAAQSANVVAEREQNSKAVATMPSAVAAMPSAAAAGAGAAERDVASFAAPACFDLAFADWAPRLNDRSRAATRRLPRRIMLDSAAVGGVSSGVRRARATAPSPAGSFTDGEWSTRANELLLEWTLDDVRVSAWLEHTPGANGMLRGDVELSGSEAPGEVAGAVTARRIACATPR